MQYFYMNPGKRKINLYILIYKRSFGENFLHSPSTNRNSETKFFNLLLTAPLQGARCKDGERQVCNSLLSVSMCETQRW